MTDYNCVLLGIAAVLAAIGWLSAHKWRRRYHRAYDRSRYWKEHYEEVTRATE